MTVHESMYRHLQMVTLAVFNDADVFPIAALPKRPPFRYVTFEQTDGDHQRHLGGGVGLNRSRFEINCYARYSADARLMADAVRRSLNDHRGDFGAADNLTNLRAAFLDDDSEEFVPPIDASQVGRARVRMDFILWHPETVTPGA